MEGECSTYKVIYKDMTHGVTDFGLEIIIYGECLGQIETRLISTLEDLDIPKDKTFKIYQIERK